MADRTENADRDPALVDKLVNAAWDVACRWSVVRASGGKLGSCELPEAIDGLNQVLDEMEPEDEE